MSYVKNCVEIVKEISATLDHVDPTIQTTVFAVSVLVAMYLFFTINVLRSRIRGK